jgi:hypothetical protein
MFIAADVSIKIGTWWVNAPRNQCRNAKLLRSKHFRAERLSRTQSQEFSNPVALERAENCSWRKKRKTAILSTH